MLISTLVPSVLWGAEHFVDPVTGSSGGDGSADAPWLSLQQVWNDGLIETRVWDDLPYDEEDVLVPVNVGAPVQPGDTIWLRSGQHGAFEIRGAYNSLPIMIAAAPGHQPRLTRVSVEASSNWHFRGLLISGQHADPPATGGTLLRIQDHGYWGPASDVVFEGGELSTAGDASSWTAQQWIDASSGISVTGDRVQLRGNLLRNVRHGITVSGDDVVVSRNTIDGFSADGLRGLGDHGQFLYNVVKNAFVGSGLGDGNHDDGFQSWSVGAGGVGTGAVTGVVLRGNVFINQEDPTHPFASTLQGIGCFDGMFVDWVVEDNVVVTNHWHGISFYGMVDSRIVNNTVLDIDDASPGPPWIRVTDSDGTPSSNVLVANNLATDFSIGGVAIVEVGNLEVADPATVFLAPPYQVDLLADGPAVDAGAPEHATTTDQRGVTRPQGAGPDLGALELCQGCLFSDGFESGDGYAWTQRLP